MKFILDRISMGTIGNEDAHDPVVAETDEEVHKQVWGTAVQARATHACVNLHLTNWVAAQQEDPILKTMIEWISNQKVQDLKHLLGDNMNTEEEKAILQEHKKLMLYQGALYHHQTLAGKLEKVLWFIVPMAHQVAAMNGCHQDARCQGQQQTLYLLQPWFWWPGMATQMQKVISNCEQCIQHEGAQPKAPMQPIIATAPLELLHVDFTNTGTTMVNVLVFCDQFTKYVMAYVIPDQTAKPVAKFLWQGYISIFGAQAKLLSD